MPMAIANEPCPRCGTMSDKVDLGFIERKVHWVTFSHDDIHMWRRTPRRKWSHAICETCWVMREGPRQPTRVRQAPTVPCCLCGRLTTSGIYKWADPSMIQCGGTGPIHSDDA